MIDMGIILQIFPLLVDTKTSNILNYAMNQTLLQHTTPLFNVSLMVYTYIDMGIILQILPLIVDTNTSKLLKYTTNRNLLQHTTSLFNRILIV